MAEFPLIARFDRDSIFAFANDRRITAAEFLQHAVEVANELPDRRHVFNSCGDRYQFAVGLAAALLRGQLTLLPPNEASQTRARIVERYRDAYCLADSATGESPLPALLVPARPSRPAAQFDVPRIPGSQPAAVVFTSGSTGEPIPQLKTWGTLVRSGRAEVARLMLDAHPMAVLGTVPPQHMYGLESTVFMPMQGGLALHSGRPFFPADVCNALEALPRPRMLVTTPVHLRAVLADGVEVPAADLVLCATAPLGIQLAQQAEERFRAPVHEIYGCTEAGQIATRRTVAAAEWRLLPGMRLRQAGEQTWISGGHVEGEVLLHDVIEPKSTECFLLHGRTADLVNIAGKRTSLASLNYQLSSIPGVRDGVFVVPPDSGEAVTRLSAFVVAPGLTPEALMEELRRRIDPAFLPRPLAFVDELPRNATGKLPRHAVEQMAASTRRTA